MLFRIRRQILLSKRVSTSLATSQNPTSKSRRPPVTLEDYVEQHKLFELLKHELPDAEELGITEQQHRALQKQQMKFSLEQQYQQKSSEDLEAENAQLADDESEVEELDPQIIIPEYHLDPQIKDFLCKVHSIRRMVSSQMRKVLTS